MLKKLQYGSYTYKKEKPKFHISIVIVILIFALIVSFLFYMIIDSENNNQNNNNDIYQYFTTLSETEPIVSSEETASEPETSQVTEKLYNPVPESTKKDYSYFDNCVFIGDSITTGLSSYGILKERNVLASVGNNIDKINDVTVKFDDEEVHISEAVKRIDPRNVYIMLGSNGIAWLTNEHMVKYYSNFIDKIKEAVPDSNIYILAIPPVTADKEKSDSGITNTNIDLYNSYLLTMCNEKDVYFVDVNTALKGNDGKFPSENAAKDGMHFKKDTYYIMLDYILSHTIEDNYYSQSNTSVPEETQNTDNQPDITEPQTIPVIDHGSDDNQIAISSEVKDSPDNEEVIFIES